MSDIIKRDDVISNAPNRWAEQYSAPHWIHSDKMIIKEKLLKLAENFTKSDVDKIIGNSSWTQLICDECRNDVEAVLCMDVNSGEYVHYICESCMIEGIKKIKGTSS